jgi:hypothetical protein
LISTDDDRSQAINRISSITPIAGWNNQRQWKQIDQSKQQQQHIAIATEPQSLHRDSTAEEENITFLG